MAQGLHVRVLTPREEGVKVRGERRHSPVVDRHSEVRHLAKCVIQRGPPFGEVHHSTRSGPSFDEVHHLMRGRGKYTDGDKKKHVGTVSELSTVKVHIFLGKPNGKLNGVVTPTQIRHGTCTK